MAASKRTRDQRERDLATIAKLYCEGQLQVDIAAKLGVSQSQISYDLRVIRGRWQRSAIRDFDTHRAEELAKVDNLEVKYWGAWESVNPVDRTAPQYLAGVMTCIDRRCKLLGIDAPLKVAPTDVSGENPYLGLNDDDLRRALLDAADRAVAGSGKVPMVTEGQT